MTSLGAATGGLGVATGWAVVANNALNVLQVVALAYIAMLVRNGRRKP